MVMTATDELRKLLDERGVEHFDIDEKTLWGCTESGFYPYSAIENFGGSFNVHTHAYDLTPAQAIEATLGRGECHNASNVTDKHGQARFVCSACGAWLDSRMLWNPEYPNGESPFVKDCRLNFCPNCGRKVVGA